MANTTTLRYANARPSMRKKAGAMAHRHNVASKKVAMVVAGVLFAFVIFLTMVQVSNKVNGLRVRIAVLQDQQEFLDAQGAALLAQWNKATRSETIIRRAQKELGLQLPEGPAYVLVRNGKPSQQRAWKNIFHGFSQTTANAAEVPGNAPLASSMSQGTP